MLKSFFTPANAALLASLIAAVGLQFPEALVMHIFEAVAAVIAIVGFFFNAIK